MIGTGISSAGRLLWPLLRRLTPSADPYLIMMISIILLVLLIWAAPAGIVWLHMRGQVKACQVTCDLKWKTRLAEKEREQNKRVDAAIEAGRVVGPVPGNRAHRLQLCRQSPTCRDRTR